MRRILISALLFLVTTTFISAQVTVSHAIALHGKPKYGPDFTHFDYVNPDAPKGGTLRLHSLGTYDTFNRYGLRGDMPPASESFYDTLMTSSDDEINVLYGLVAEKIEYPADYTWVIFHINPKARHQDGKPITAEDVAFSFNLLMTKGVPQYRTYYEGVTAEVLDRLQVRFNLPAGDKEMVSSLASTTIFPPQYWQEHDISEPSTEVPLGSGAYTVSDYKMGQYIVYERIKDYWAMDLPVNKGRLNFDHIRYDFYRDENVSLEAFKAGEYDFYQETIAKNWFTMHSGPNYDAGYILKEEIPHEIPQGMPGFVFNIQRDVFKDRRVRQALNLALDFQWMNKNLFYSQYTRTRSYFQNSEYEAKGLPSPEELKILEPIKDQIPSKVFTSEYNPPVTDGSGNIRSQIREALKILKEAGWEIREVADPNQELTQSEEDTNPGVWQKIKNFFGGGEKQTGVRKLVNVETGEPMEFELIIYSPSYERVAIPLQQNLEKMGITMNIRTIDTTQYLNRARERDFDLIDWGYSAQPQPGSDLKVVWHSDYIDSSYNRAGVQDKAVDYLVEGVVDNQENETMLKEWTHALDRVLTWNYYVIPWWHQAQFKVSSWNRFSRPAVRPKYALGLDTWWFDSSKDSALPEKFR